MTGNAKEITRRTARRTAERLGHRLGRFKAQRYTRDSRRSDGLGGQVMYYAAWCEVCGDVAFAEGSQGSDVNPALTNTCRKGGGR